MVRDDSMITQQCRKCTEEGAHAVKWVARINSFSNLVRLMQSGVVEGLSSVCEKNNCK